MGGIPEHDEPIRSGLDVLSEGLVSATGYVSRNITVIVETLLSVRYSKLKLFRSSDVSGESRHVLR